jgi:hypothetical protein
MGDAERHTFTFVKCVLVGVYPFFSHAVFVGMGDVGCGGSDFTLASQVFDGRCILQCEWSQDQAFGSEGWNLRHNLILQFLVQLNQVKPTNKLCNE